MPESNDQRIDKILEFVTENYKVQTQIIELLEDIVERLNNLTVEDIRGYD